MFENSTAKAGGFVRFLTKLVLVCTCLALTLQNARAADDFLKKLNVGNFEKCMRAAQFGPTQKKLKIYGHHFNCKRMRADKLKDGGFRYSGQLSHHLRARKDDQMNFSFVIDKNNRVDPNRVVINIKRGGAAVTLVNIASPIRDPFTRALLQFLPGVPVRDLPTIFDGKVRLKGQPVTKWEDVGQLLILEMAVRKQASLKPLVDRPTTTGGSSTKVPGNANTGSQQTTTKKIIIKKLPAQ